MMYGTREEFDYIECSQCGCVQILDFPESFDQYYPKDYYSFQKKKLNLIRSIKRWLLKQSIRNRLHESLSRKVFSKFTKNRYPWLNSHCGIRLDSRVLDVGCGNGSLLSDLHYFGFQSLKGVDPFAADDLILEGSVQILKQDICTLGGEFDFIMLHHSFEHMINPKEVFHHLNSLLAPNGTLLIRVPIADSYAYETYGKDWAELDAPRHVFLHTHDSIHLLASEVNLELVDVMYDSTRFEILESENIKRGIPLIDKSKLFSKRERLAFGKLAKSLNEKGKAGRACFYFRSTAE